MILLLVDIDNKYLFGINELIGMWISIEILFWIIWFSEPIRNETLDIVGQSEKLKCSLASPNHLLSVYDSRLAKIKIYDFRFLTVSDFLRWKNFFDLEII